MLALSLVFACILRERANMQACVLCMPDAGNLSCCLYDAALCNALYCPVHFIAQRSMGESLQFAKHTKYANSQTAKLNAVEPAKHPLLSMRSLHAGCRLSWLRRAGFHTCRLNGLLKDSADRDIRPTYFVGSTNTFVGQVSIPATLDASEAFAKQAYCACRIRSMPIHPRFHSERFQPAQGAYSGDVDRVFRVMPITQTGHGDHQSGERWLDRKS
jgi:hypothetical protein